MRVQARLLLTLATLTALPLFSALCTDNTGKVMDITFCISDGENDNPMMVLWLENDAGEFIQTLHIFSERKIHYDKLKNWILKSKNTEKQADVDAVSGPTIGWNQTNTISIPAQIGTINLLDGERVLCLESRTHFGGNYWSLKIPLTKGYAGSVHKNNGSMKLIEIKVRDKTN